MNITWCQTPIISEDKFHPGIGAFKIEIIENLAPRGIGLEFPVQITIPEDDIEPGQ